MKTSRKTRLILVAVCLVGLTAVPAMAEGAGEKSVMDSGNAYNALWAIGIFAVLVVLLGKFAWGPITKSLEARDKAIADALAKAAAQQEESQRLLERYRKQLEEADIEATRRLEQAQKSAAEAYEKIVAAAKAEAESLAKRATEEIDAAKQAALGELYNFAADLATDVAAKIIRRQLNPADQRQLVDESLQQIRQHAKWREH
jgi:F-type H+-transporting ATPase subunit b